MSRGDTAPKNTVANHSSTPPPRHRLAANSKFASLGPTRRPLRHSLLVLSSPCTRVVPTVVRRRRMLRVKGKWLPKTSRKREEFKLPPCLTSRSSALNRALRDFFLLPTIRLSGSASYHWDYAFPLSSLLFSLPSEGLKKVRNPDRMYRSAVCYAGHGPPKSISDDTETNNEHGHLKIYLPKKLLECLPKCTSLPKERHRWNTNEAAGSSGSGSAAWHLYASCRHSAPSRGTEEGSGLVTGREAALKAPTNDSGAESKRQEDEESAEFLWMADFIATSTELADC
ncbi:Calmodulin-binding transcription activator 1 [Takifugu flavidus]|uniref:Calmodulin-binding transcription activator 1 n=1 Tax=Takifugu flavidus TaxID=433684 RepID=A0A5C6MQ21_9TELE|nr:Calmodulin-binding transcription activator 1 [Takifugu flavidus]